MKKVILGIVFAVLFTGCAMKMPKANITDSWIGANQSELIRSWGAPAKSEADGRGGSMLVYINSSKAGQSPEMYVFYIDRNGIITSATQSQPEGSRSFFK